MPVASEDLIFILNETGGIEKREVDEDISSSIDPDFSNKMDDDFRRRKIVYPFKN